MANQLWTGAVWAAVSAAAFGQLPRGPQTVERMKADLYYLTSSTLEGRGIATKGIDFAAEHLRAEFRRLGLKSANPDGSYFHHFEYGNEPLVETAKTSLTAPALEGAAPALGKDFAPLAYGGPGKFSGPVVFAGYGVQIPGKHDDFAGLDVAGKVVLILRKTPKFQDAEAAKLFAGAEAAKQGAFDVKLRTLAKLKAAAVLVANDAGTVEEEKGDKLPAVGYLGARRTSVPLAMVTRAFADRLLAGTPVGTLAAAEAKIAATAKPASLLLPGRTIAGEFAFGVKLLKLKNIVAMIEGKGPTANETVVVGAHYDHVGYGEFGSLAPPNLRGRIHHGADDNASGTTTILELARRFAEKPAPARRLVFIAFSAEESGLIGSKEYVKAPFHPISGTAAMLNLDMVGRLRDDNVETAGYKSAAEFEKLLNDANANAKLKLKNVGPQIRGDSDHASFTSAGVPALFLFTGMHKEYHSPLDVAATINFEGMAKVADLAEGIVERFLAMPRPAFVKAPPRVAGKAPPAKPRLGILPDPKDTAEGVKVGEMLADSAARKAGMQVGDRIVEIAGKPIKALPDIAPALANAKPGDTLSVVVQRALEKKSLQVKF